MADVTVSQFAEVLKVPVERLLTQLDEAGIQVSGADATISDEAKMELLTFLRRAHGRTEDAASPRKITLKRKSQGEIKVASAQGRARMVNVEVRRKKTYLNRSVLEEQARVQHEEVGPAEARAERQEARARTREHEEEQLEAASALEAEAARGRAANAQRQQLEEEARRRADEEARVARRGRSASPGRSARAPGSGARAQRRPPKTAKVTRAGAREPPRIQRAELHVSSDASARFKKKKQHQASQVAPPGAGQRYDASTASSGPPRPSSAMCRSARPSRSPSWRSAWP